MRRIRGRAQWMLVACCALAAAGDARGDGPGLDYDPFPDSSASSPTSESCQLAPTNTIELDFAADCTPGTPCPIDVTPDTTPGTTTLSCLVQPISGNGSIGVIQTPSQFSFASGGATQTLFATCSPGSLPSRGRLCCTEIRGFDKSLPVFDVACPATATPVFASDPTAGTTLVLTGSTGVTVQRTIVVDNAGTATLTVTPQASAAAFAVTPANASIAPSDLPLGFAVSCVPAAEVARSELRMDTNDPAHASAADAIVFPLECVSDAAPPMPRPRFSATAPETIQASVGTPGNVILTVSNTGDALLTLGSASVGTPFQISPAGASIAPATSSTFTVYCVTAAAGPYNSVVSYDTNDPDRDPAQVLVNCVISPDSAPIFASDPPAPGPLVISTAPQTTGTVSLIVRNDGTAALTVTSAAFLPGSSGNLSVAPGSSSAIVPLDTRTFTVSCTAALACSHTGTLRIATTAGSADYNVTCGVNAVPAPRYGSNPPPGGTIAIETPQSTPRDGILTIQNAGNATLSILSITGPTGPQVTRAPVTLPLSIGAGTSATVTLTCSSAMAGTFMDQVSIGSNAAATPSANYPVSCNVAGPPPVPQFTSVPAAPGPVVLSTRQGVPVSSTLMVGNPGTGALQITGIGNLQAPFSVTPASATILPAASAGFVVGCSATESGSFIRNVSFQTNVPRLPAVGFDLACNVEFEPATVTFSPPLTYAVGNMPRGLATGQLDFDGLRDVVVVNRNSNSVSILYGTGTGGFRPRMDFFVGTAPFAVALGQLNGDGRPDLVVANNGNNDVSVLVSSGQTGYFNAGNQPMGSPIDIALGRLNMDPFDDIATVTASIVSFRLGQGGGSFGSRTDIGVAGQPEGVEIADLNGDTFGDIVVALTDSNAVGVMRGNGNGTFQMLVPYPAGITPTEMRVADFNRDGRPDVAATNSFSNSVTVLLGTSTGFEAGRTLAVDNFPFALDVADFNRDDRLDIAATGGPSVSVLLGRGDGRFASALTFSVSGGAQGLGAGDFDNDGASDLVASNSGLNAISVIINGPGRFLAASGQTTTNRPIGVVAADFDRDGRADAAAANSGANAVDVLRGNGDGTLQPHTRFDAGAAPMDVATADFNGDGILDLVTAETSSGPSLFIGTGNGSFQPRTPVAGAGTTTSVAAGDVTGDQRPDLAFAGGFSEVLLFRWNSTQSAFEPLTTLNVSLPKSVALGDLDRDGDLDLVVAAGNNQFSPFLNNGTGAFAAGASSSIGSAYTSVAIADFNRDGFQDLVFGSATSQSIAVLLGNGVGGFPGSAILNPLGLQSVREIAPADINGDSRMDLLVTAINSASPSLGLMLGAGDGSLQPPIPYPMGVAPNGLAVGAFNNDQAPDVVVTDPDTSRVLVRLNATANYGIVFSNGFE